jgi:hypothetical protein
VQKYKKIGNWGLKIENSFQIFSNLKEKKKRDFG